MDDKDWLDAKDWFTVKDLRFFLEKYPENTEVFVTGKGVFYPITKSCIYMSKKGNLLIDADNCFYKKEFAQDPMENE